MSRIDSVPLCAVLVTAAIAIGCQDSTTEPAEPLSMQETEALYLGMQQMRLDSTAQVVSATPDGAVIACPLGGQATVAFEVREEAAADTARLLTDITIDPDGCMLSSEGYEYTLDGNPNVRFEVNTTIIGSTFEFLVDGSMTGGVDWQLEDRTGTCLIDLVLDVELGEQMMVTFTGTMCGHEVEFDAGEVVTTGGGS